MSTKVSSFDSSPNHVLISSWNASIYVQVNLLDRLSYRWTFRLSL